MKIFIVIFALILNIWGFDLNDLSNNLVRNVSGDFKQIRKIGSAKIESSGAFKLSDGELIWEILHPLQQSIKINKDGIFLKQNNIYSKLENNIGDEFFFNIISLNFDVLGENFDFLLEGDLKSWRLNLVPKNAMVKNRLRDIKIKGSKAVESAELVEQNGNSIINIFSNIK